MEYNKPDMPSDGIKKRLNELTEYYDTHSTADEMEDGEWVFPQQLELDLGLIPLEWDDDQRYSLVNVHFSFLSELTTHQYNDLVDAILAAVDDKGWSDFVMSASIKSGTDRELYPEEYEDESKEPDGTGKEEV